MTGPAFLLTADHQDPLVAAREAQRRLGAGAEVGERARLVAAVAAEGFDERVARDAVDSLSTDGDPTRSCASGVESAVSDD